MRYIGLFVLVTVAWLFVAIAGAAHQALVAARAGTTSGGTSVLGGVFLGWALFAAAIGIDFPAFSGGSAWPLGFWAVLVFHALLGIAALAYWAYAAFALRGKNGKENP